MLTGVKNYCLHLLHDFQGDTLERRYFNCTEIRRSAMARKYVLLVETRGKAIYYMVVHCH